MKKIYFYIYNFSSGEQYASIQSGITKFIVPNPQKWADVADGNIELLEYVPQDGLFYLLWGDGLWNIIREVLQSISYCATIHWVFLMSFYYIPTYYRRCLRFIDPIEVIKDNLERRNLHWPGEEESLTPQITKCRTQNKPDPAYLTSSDSTHTDIWNYAREHESLPPDAPPPPYV